ncbi:hypothetical protein, partial [Nocardia seriolae]
VTRRGRIKEPPHFEGIDTRPMTIHQAAETVFAGTAAALTACADDKGTQYKMPLPVITTDETHDFYRSDGSAIPLVISAPDHGNEYIVGKDLHPGTFRASKPLLHRDVTWDRSCPLSITHQDGSRSNHNGLASGGESLTLTLRLGDRVTNIGQCDWKPAD